MIPIQRFEETYSRFVALIGSLPEEVFLAPMNGWSPRDVVAHLIGWNSLMIASCQDILKGKPPAYYSDAENDYRNINAGFVARFVQRDRETLLAELTRSKQALVAFLDTIDLAEWEADHGVVHHSGDPATIARVLSSLAGDYQDHTLQIETWLKETRTGQEAPPGI